MTVIVSLIGNVSVVTLIRTDTTLDHSQKAEKVWARHHLPKNKVDIAEIPLFDASQTCGSSRLWEKGELTCLYLTHSGLGIIGRLSPLKNCKNVHMEQLDGNWSSFQLAKSTPPLGVIDRAIAPSARMLVASTLRWSADMHMRWIFVVKPSQVCVIKNTIRIRASQRSTDKLWISRIPLRLFHRSTQTKKLRTCGTKKVAKAHLGVILYWLSSSWVLGFVRTVACVTWRKLKK